MVLNLRVDIFLAVELDFFLGLLNSKPHMIHRLSSGQSLFRIIAQQPFDQIFCVGGNVVPDSVFQTVMSNLYLSHDF
jgi:hypothetical protein